MKTILSFLLALCCVTAFGQTVPQVNNVPWYQFSNKLTIGKQQLKSAGHYTTSFTIPTNNASVYLGEISTDRNVTFPSLTVYDTAVTILVFNLNSSAFHWNVIGSVEEANGDAITVIPTSLSMYSWSGASWVKLSTTGVLPEAYDTIFVAAHNDSLFTVLYSYEGIRDSSYCCMLGGGGGLTLYTGDDTIHNTRTVTQDVGVDLTFNGNTSGGVISVTNAGNGTGVFVIPTTGPGVYVAGQGYAPAYIGTSAIEPVYSGTMQAISNTNVSEIMKLEQTEGFSSLAGYGTSIGFYLKDAAPSGNSTLRTGRIINQLISPTVGAVTSSMSFAGLNAGTAYEWMKLIPSYQIVNNGADTLATRAYSRSVAGGLSSIANRTYLGNVSGSTATPDTLHYSVFNVKDFGLVDDSSTDNTTAFRALLAQVPDGSRIHFPGGGLGYLFNDSILINKNVIIYGDGYSFFKVYTIDNLPRRGATNLFFSAGNKNFLCLDSSLTNDNPIVQISNLTIKSTATSTPTTSNGIIIRGGVGKHMISRITITGFYNNINCVATNNLSIEWCNILSPVQDAIILGNTKEGDYGNWHIKNNNIYSGLSSTTVARGIYIKGGGGIDISNNYFNAQATLTINTGFMYHIYSDFSQGLTSEISIKDNFFDNYQTSGIKLRNYSGNPIRIGNMALTGNEFAPLYNNATTLAAIDISNFDNFLIDATVGAQVSSTAYPVVALDSCINVVLGSIVVQGFNARYSATANVTGLKDLSLSVTGLSGGQTIIGGTAASNDLTLTSTSHATKGKINTGNLYVTGTTLSGSSATANFLNVTGTFPGTRTAETNGVAFNLTGAGSSSQNLIGVNSSLLAGYTGSSQTQAIAANNYSAGTGSSIAGGLGTTLFANFGAVLGARGSTATGSNIGSYNWAYQALKNVGIVGDATLSQTNSASALSGGVIGLALRTNSSAIEFGGYFGLQGTQPTFKSAALIANNSAETVPVQIWQVNGSDVAAVSSIGILNTFKGGAVASAAAIVPTGNSFHVTGTTTITSITTTGLVAGTVITIIFDGALTFTDGSNLILAGNFVTTADDTITLLYDGTNFYEQSRSVN